MYYSEFLGLADSIDDENMVTGEEKSAYEKRIAVLEGDREKTNELVRELIRKVSELQSGLRMGAGQSSTLDQSGLGKLLQALTGQLIREALLLCNHCG